MTDLIERLKEHKEWAEANIWEVPITLPDDIAEAIEALPKKGKWTDVTEYDEDVGLTVIISICSCCGMSTWGGSKFCPNCGADMRGETNERIS